MTASPTSDGHLYYTRCPAPTATGLAVGLDLLAPKLAEHHVELTALQDVWDPELRQRHFDHGIVNLVREGGNIPALWAASQGESTRLIGITWLDEFQAIVTLPSSPVHEVAGLAGRRVAVPVSPGSLIDVGRASTLRGFERALSTVELGLDAVELVYTLPRPPMSGPRHDGRGEQFDAELALLQAGKVDAVWLKGAGGVAAVRELGLRAVLRIDLDPAPLVRVNNGTPRTLTVRQELVDEHPELVRTYLRTLRAGSQLLHDDRERLWSVLSRETHEAVEDAETAYVNVTTDSLMPSLDSLRIEALQHQADFLFASGFIPHPLDVREWALDIMAMEPAGT